MTKQSIDVPPREPSVPAWNVIRRLGECRRNPPSPEGDGGFRRHSPNLRQDADFSQDTLRSMKVRSVQTFRGTPFHPPHFFLSQIARRSSEHCWRTPLSVRISSVARTISWRSKTRVSELRSSKAMEIYFSWVSRRVSTRWRRLRMGTPLTSLTTLEKGFE